MSIVSKEVKIINAFFMKRKTPYIRVLNFVWSAAAICKEREKNKLQ